MAKRKGNLGRAIRLMVSTRPFLWARLAVYGVFFFATIGYTTTFALLLRWSETTIAQLLILAVAGGLYLLGRRYLARHLTYAGHAPHVRAMVDILKGRKLPKGNAQIDASMRALDESMFKSRRLFDLERLVGKVVRDVRDVVIEPATFKPLPGYHRLGKLGWVIGRVATRHVREGIFGYTLWREERNVYETARRGVILFARDATPIKTSAFRVAATGFLFGIVMLAIALWPGWTLITAAFDANVFMFLAVAAGFVKAVWVVKNALYDPIGSAWMISMFVNHAEGAEWGEADREAITKWEDKLGKASKRYRELSEKARDMAGPPPLAPRVGPSEPDAKADDAELEGDGGAVATDTTDADESEAKPSVIIDDEALKE